MQIWVTDDILRRQGWQWHWETSLFALLYTQQLACPQQHYASSMCALPLCAVQCIKYEKKKRSLNCEKQNKNKQVICCSLPIVQRLIISTEGKAKAGWSDRSRPNTETKRGLLLIKCSKVGKKTTTHLCAKMQLYCVNGAFIGHVSLLLPSQLPVILYDV